MTERLAGLRRYAWWDGRANAHCQRATCTWVASGKHDAVARLARAHAREHGHDTEVQAWRIVSYKAAT